MKPAYQLYPATKSRSCLLTLFLSLQAGLVISFYTFLFAFYGNESNVYITLVWLFVGVIASIKENGMGVDSTKFYIILLMIIAPFNVLSSDNLVQTSMRWVGLLLLIKVVDWVSSRSIEEFMRVMERITPWLLFGLIAADIVYLHFNPLDSGRVASHMTSIYANLLLVFSLFSLPRLKSIVWLLTSLIAIYYSGSRGALAACAGTLIAFSLLLVYMRRYLIGITLLGSMIFVGINYDRAVNVFSETKVAEGVDALESAMKSGEGRIELANLVWSRVMDHPLRGNGFQKIAFYSGGEMLESHTGHLTLFLYLGIPMALCVFGFFVYGFLKIIFSNLKRKLKVFYILVFIVFNLRSASEPLTIFDLGSLFTFYFLIIHFAFYFNSRNLRNSEIKYA